MDIYQDYANGSHPDPVGERGLPGISIHDIVKIYHEYISQEYDRKSFLKSVPKSIIDAYNTELYHKLTDLVDRLEPGMDTIDYIKKSEEITETVWNSYFQHQGMPYKIEN